MSALIFSSDKFFSISAPKPLRYRAEVSGENYVGLFAEIIGGTGNTFFVKGDWRQFLRSSPTQTLTLTEIGVGQQFTSNQGFSYNSVDDRTEILTSEPFDAKWDTIESSNFAPIFEPLIQELITEWQDQGDILLGPIKESHTVITFNNNDEFFERFIDLFLNGNDDEFKLIIYRRNDADTDWDLEWAGNMVVDGLEWDNMDKPRPNSFRAIDGINMLKDVNYEEALTGTTAQPLISHLITALGYINTSQFWGASDAYIRESNEYVSTDIAGLTDSDSVFEYAFFDDRVFIQTDNDDILEGLDVYSVIVAIMEILSCRIFLAQGIWWVQQIRNFNNPTVIVFREFTTSIGAASTRGTFNHKKTVGQGDRAKDLVQMTGGTFNNHVGLLNVKIVAEQPGLVQNTVDDTVGRLSNATLTFNRQYSLGRASGGIGTGAKIRIEFWIDELINPEPLGTYFFECQLKMIGGNSFIQGSDVVDPFWGSFINDNIIGGTGNTYFIADDKTSLLTTSTVLQLVDESGSDITANVVSFSFNAGQNRTEIVTDVTFEARFDRMFAIIANSFWSKKINSIQKGNKTLMVFETPELPFDAELDIRLDFFLTGSTTVGFEYWRIYNLRTFVPSDDGDIADIEYNVGNPNSNFTKELDLGTLIVDDESKVVAVNALQVDKEFTSANPRDLIKSTVWDADFPIDGTLTQTRALEAMALQFKPVQILRSNIEGDYYPFFSLSYNNKIYAFAGFKFNYMTDEQDGEWFEVASARAGVSTIKIKKIRTPEGGVINGEEKKHSNTGRDNLMLLATADGTTPATGGDIGTITINATGHSRIKAGDTLDIIHIVSNSIVETVIVATDVGPTDVVIGIIEQTIINDITDEMLFVFKKGEVVDAKIIRGETLVGAGGLNNELLFNNNGVVDGTEFLTVDESTKTFRFSTDLVPFLEIRGSAISSNREVTIDSGATFPIELSSGSGKVGFNTPIPTAVADLDGGNGSIAALRIRNQTAVVSPNEGDVYQDDADNKLYFYNGTVLDILSVAGLDTEVQFNNGGVRSTSSQFIYDHTNDRLKLGGSVLTAVLNVQGINTANSTSSLKIENSAGDILLDTRNDGEFLIFGRIEQVGLGNSVFMGFNSGVLEDGNNRRNVGIGDRTLAKATSGGNNMAFGREALNNLTTSSSNIGIGVFALNKLTTGGNNIGIGPSAGRFIANGSTSNLTPSNGIYIGNSTRAKTDGASNEIVIGLSAIGNDSNTTTIGGAATTDTFLAGDLHVDNRVLYTETITLGDNSTPTVAEGDVFVTGGTTTIIDFDNGVVTQTIRILAEHTITITDGTPIQLDGGGNFAMVSGNTLTLTMFNDQIWHETART